MLRKVKHLGRKASRYRFSAALNELTVQGSKSWQPHKLIVVWTRRKKRKATLARSWRPSIENPYKGAVSWSGQNQETLEVVITLFDNHSTAGYEPKEWVFVLENETREGKRKPIATARLEMSQYVSDVPSPQAIELSLKPLNRKLVSAKLLFTLTCVFMSSGPATEADLASVAGSTASEDTIRLGDIDVADMNDLDDRDYDSRSTSTNGRDNSSMTQQELKTLTQQIESLNHAMEDKFPLSISNHADNIVTGESSAANRSRHSSTCSMRSERTSTSIKSTHSNKRQKCDGANSSDHEDGRSGTIASNRESVASSSSDSSSSFQKRRLRPSVDFVPSPQVEKLEISSVTQTSPAPDVQKSLLSWCQRVTAGHQGIKVTNFTTSWRNGLALCAVLHHFRPDLIDFEGLSALNGRNNLKKAVDGFNTMEIMGLDRFDNSIVSDKNRLITALTCVRQHCKDEAEIQDDQCEDTVSPLQSPSARAPLPRVNRKGSPAYAGNYTLCDTARIKLLSDLEEKQGEDDVFSLALDEALEEDNEKGLSGSTRSLTSEESNVPKQTVVDVLAPPPSEKRTSSSMENRSPTSLVVVPRRSSSKEVPLDIVLSSLESTSNPVGVIIDENVKRNDNDTTGSTSNVIVNEQSQSGHETVESVPPEPFSTLLEKSINLEKEFGDLMENSQIESTNPFENDEDLPPEIEVPASDTVLVHEHPEDAAELMIQIHIPAEDDQESSAVEAVTPESVNTELPDQGLSEKSDNGSAIDDREVKKHKDNVTREEENREDEKSTLDVAVKLHDEKRKDDDLQRTVDRLLKSSAERSKKSKTLELIEKAKAEVAVTKAEAKSPTELKKEEEARERAQRLIEETRATLGRGKKKDTSDVENSSSSAETCSQCSNTDTPPSSTHETFISDVSVSVHFPEQPTVQCQSSTTVTSETDKVEPSNGPFSASTPLLTPKIILNDSDKNKISEAPQVDCQRPSGVVPQRQHATDFSNHSRTGNTSTVPTTNHPLSGDSEIQCSKSNLTNSSTPREDKIHLPSSESSNAENLNPFLNTESGINEAGGDAALLKANGDFSSTPTKEVKMRNPASTNDLQTPDRLRPNASGDVRNCASIELLERLSVSDTSELQKRLNTVLLKRSSSALNDDDQEEDELEIEKLALEKQLQLVEERSAEVQMEIQSVKTSGRRNKRAEADLMQEWFQLVNKKNAILRQQDLIALMEEELDIQKNVEKLHEELIPLMSIEDSMKTKVQREREEVLLEEKVRLVNERDRVIQIINEKEQTAVDEEELLQANLGQNMSTVMQQDEKCCVM